MTVLDPKIHARLGWRKAAGFGFARRHALQAIAADEIPLVAQSIPVAFRRVAGRWEAIAVLGPVHGANVYVAADGRWRSSYVPAALRVYPFALAGDAGGLRLWEGVEPLPVEGEGVVSFFLANETLADEAAQIEAFLVKLHGGIAAVGPALTLLETQGLLTPWCPPDVATTDEGVVMAGLHAIDRAGFEALEDSAWLILRKLDAVRWIYAHFDSLAHAGHFKARARTLIADVKEKSGSVAAGRPLASFLEALSADLEREG